jgi:hypothetical protein
MSIQVAIPVVKTESKYAASTLRGRGIGFGEGVGDKARRIELEDGEVSEGWVVD